MYLTVKQQIKHLSKDDYHTIKELCHIAKNLTNESIYNIRQYYFTEGEYLRYEKNYVLLKNSLNYKSLNSNMAQQILREVDGSFKSFFGLLKLAKKGKIIAILGLAFKPETDDMREAPSLILIDLLIKAGVTVKVYDPVAMDECRRRVGDKVIYCQNMYEAAEGADALMLVTEWKEFRIPNTDTLLAKMHGRLILDGRNILDGEELRLAGFEYHCIGK